MSAVGGQPPAPVVAPWITAYTRFPVQQDDLLAGQGVTPPVSGSFLGTYTLAEWPPNAGAVGTGQVAQLADSTGSLTYAWLLEYRPDLDVTYPWRSYDAKTLSVAVFRLNTTSSTATPSTAAGSFAVPLAGVYHLDAYIGGGTTGGGAGSATLQIGTTSTGTDIGTLTGTSTAGSRGLAAGPGSIADYTATKGETIYVSYLSSTYGEVGGLTVAVRPVNVANS